jgi:cryptochrome
MSKIASTGKSLHWFRKCLRLHDNPSLLHACHSSSQVYPLFILDPKFNQGQMSLNRHQFLLECLIDLDRGLRELGSRLFVARGRPWEVLPSLVRKWGVSLVTMEKCSGPYARVRDERVIQAVESVSLEIGFKV